MRANSGQDNAVNVFSGQLPPISTTSTFHCPSMAAANYGYDVTQKLKSLRMSWDLHRWLQRFNKQIFSIPDAVLVDVDGLQTGAWLTWGGSGNRPLVKS